MTEEKFIDFIKDFGNQVNIRYGENTISKRWHLELVDRGFSFMKSVVSSDGTPHDIGLEINGKDATLEECVSLVSAYERDQKLQKLGI